MIVDDEPYIRRMLREMGNWNGLGFELCAESFNGRDAMQKIREAAKDGAPFSLILTDVRMPVMDGLALIREAREFDPRLTFAVISAYDDFHLVKDAFLLGAREYLLKSEVTASQLNGMLSRFYQIGNQSVSTDAARDSALFTSSPVQHGVLWMRMLSNPPDVKTIARAFWESSGALVYSLEFECAILPIGTEELRVVLQYSLSETDTAVKDHLFRVRKRLSDTGVRANIGVSGFYAEAAEETRRAQEARTACDCCFLSGNGGILFFPYLPRHAGTNLGIPRRIELLRRILLERYTDQQKRQVDARALLVDKAAISPVQIAAARELFTHYAFVLSECTQSGGNPEAQRLLDRYHTGLRFHGDVDELNGWLSEILHRLAGSQQSLSLVKRIQYYLEKHFALDVSLASVAAHFEISGSYLSHVFSRQVGVSFVDYLAALRVNHALELMQSTNMKLYEIGERVGYPNPEVFSRVFKKVVGKSPKQYMRG
jgi:AraC-like DNA-binding protein/DNA-binding NarL/FixJ family response regulator